MKILSNILFSELKVDSPYCPMQYQQIKFKWNINKLWIGIISVEEGLVATKS